MFDVRVPFSTRSAFFFALLFQVGCSSTPDEVVATLEYPFMFEKVAIGTAADSIRHHNGSSGQKWFPETMSGGAAFADIDSDGDLDVLFVEGGALNADVTSSKGSIGVLLNNGEGVFSRAHVEGLSDLPGYGMGIYPADLDNDGDFDILYTTLGQNSVLINNEGSFTSTQNDLFEKRISEWSTAAVIFDADQDGWLDLLIGNYVDWTVEKDLYCTTDGMRKGYCTPELYQGTPAVFYRNTGKGTFVDVTAGSGFEKMSGKTLGLAMSDVDSDGQVDIFVANDTDPDQLLVAINGTYEDRGIASGLAFDERGRARAGMGIDTGISDETGKTTLFVGNFSDEMMGVYRQIGPLSFLDRAASSGIGHPSTLTLTFGLTVTDFNLDGNQDVFAANGHVEQSIETIRDNVRYAEYPHLFSSDGKGRFEDVASSVGAFGAMVGRAAVVGDIDMDGDPDLMVLENNASLHVFKNTSTHSGIRVQLKGTASNAQGIGTRVELWQAGSRQERMIKTGSSYLSGSDVAAFFGLGATATADSLVLHWPSGTIQVVNNVKSGNLIVEESAQW